LNTVPIIRWNVTDKMISCCYYLSAEYVSHTLTARLQKPKPSQWYVCCKSLWPWSYRIHKPQIRNSS